MRALLRKIFDVPNPRMNRPGASSCTTRASIATCTGWRVNGEMIPHPIVSFDVSFAINAETTVDDRASIWCLRHHGYASASQIVSKPCSSRTRAVASISASGSIVSCITPMRKGGGTKTILADDERAAWARSSSPLSLSRLEAEDVLPPRDRQRPERQQHRTGEARRPDRSEVPGEGVVACRDR